MADETIDMPERGGITLPQFTWTFVPFGLLVTVALLYPELSENIALFRTIYLIRAALLLAVGALVLFPFVGFGDTPRNLWRLFWTLSLFGHIGHLIYAVFFVFGVQLETARLYPEYYGLSADNVSIYSLIVEQQTAFVVWSNIVVTILWLIDVLLAWTTSASGPKSWIFHVLTWLYVIVSFLGSTVYFDKNPVSYYLGIGLIVSVAISLLIRAFWRHPAPSRLS